MLEIVDLPEEPAIGTVESGIVADNGSVGENKTFNIKYVSSLFNRILVTKYHIVLKPVIYGLSN